MRQQPPGVHQPSATTMKRAPRGEDGARIAVVNNLIIKTACESFV
jgi:hypothetical protein